MSETLSLEQVRNKAFDLVTQKYKDKGNLDRLEHIYGVEKMAVTLAKRYNVDEKKASIAALMHDYYKYEDTKVMKEVIEDEDLLKECEETPVLYHSYASAQAFLDLLDFPDDEIYEAIKNHVYGNTKLSRLCEIILISDYTEEGRKYENCILCRELLHCFGINTAIWASTSFVIRYLEKKGNKPNLVQYDVLDLYKEKMKMEMLNKIKDNIERVKGYDVICYDMKGVSPLFDYMIIVSIDSPRQAEALTQYVKEDYAKVGITLNAIEGKGSSWVLMDCKDIIIHIFTPDEREHYSLEKIYMEMPKIEL